MRIVRLMDATLAGQTATLTPKTGEMDPLPNHLAITAASITLAANAALFFGDASGCDYILTIERKTNA